ncbi:MAG: hypothetical protein ACOZNI_07090 [Myxococcota bacterium]
MLALLLIACGAPPPGSRPLVAAPADALVSARLARGPVETDDVVRVYGTSEASVHLQLLGPGQRLPAHVSDAAATCVPVTGRVTLARAGSPAAPLTEPTAVPAGASRAWVNEGGDPAAFLVFQQPGRARARFVADEVAGRGSGPADLRAMVVDERTVLPADPERDTVLYVLAGRGRLAQGEGAAALAPGVIAAFDRLAPVAVEPAEPLSVLLFEPRRPLADDAGDEAPATPPPPGAVVDLRARLEEARDAADLVIPLYASPTASAHLHGVGGRSLVPLHLHRRTTEAALVIGGAPEVTAGTWTRTLPAPLLVISPPGTPHRWANPDAEVQGNLVFAAPPFDENLYVETGDPRAGDAPATIWDPATAPAHAEPVGLGGRLRALTLGPGETADVPAGVAYAVTGAARLGAVDVRAGSVVVGPSGPITASVETLLLVLDDEAAR